MLRVKTANPAIDVIGKIRRLIEIMLGFSAWLMSNMKNRMAALGCDLNWSMQHIQQSVQLVF